MKKNKKLVLSLCSLAFAGALALACSTLSEQTVEVQAGTADETTTFEMIGAGVRYGDEGGVRFGVTVAKSYIDELASGGEVVLHSSIDKKGGTADGARTCSWTLSGDDALYDASYTTNTFYHSIDFSGLNETQLTEASAVELTATMWLSVNGTKVDDTEQSLTRAMRVIANAAYDESDKQSELDKYLGTRTTVAGKAYAEVVVDSTAETTAVSKIITPTDYSEMAQYVSMDEVGSASTETPITVKGAKELGTWEETIACFDDSNNVYNIPIVYATDAIESTDELAKVMDSSDKSGYYILTSDIGNTSSRADSAQTKNTTATFTGTLDGNGYTAYVKIAGYSMLGYLGDGATVKNIKLDTTFSKPDTASYGFILGKSVTAKADNKAKIENVYITSDASQTVLTPALHGGSRSTNAIVRNVIWEMNFLLGDYSSINKNRGFFGYDSCKDDDGNRLDGSGELENLYMISTTVTHAAHSDKDIVWYAANDTALMTSEASTYSSQYQYAKGTVHRFESVSAMYADAEYGAKKVGNWSVSENGGITWVD